MSKRIHTSAVAALVLACPVLVQAYDLPPVNLGFTSFLDGAPPSGPGWYFQQYLQFQHDGELRDENGDKTPLPKLDVTSGLSQLVYQSDQELAFGAKWGVNLMLPVAGFDRDPDDSPLLSSNRTGVGDLLIGPFLQWDPVMGEHGPRFVHRVELQMIFPTGKYDDDYAINPGSNFFSFDPYWAGTLFLSPKWTASWRLHYLWNAKNEDPWKATALDDVQAGQAVHLNFATAYEILPNRLRLGLNGYYLKQITDTKFNGDEIAGRREQVLGIGPGLVYHLSPNTHLFFNAYFESHVENRSEGNRYNLRLVHHFD